MKPVIQKILAYAESNPYKPAIISGDSSTTYDQLATRVREIATTLKNQFGVQAGDRVVLMARSDSDFVCTYLANHCLGAINVPLDPQASAPRFSNIVQRVEPRLVISEDRTPAAVENVARFADLDTDGVAPYDIPSAQPLDSQAADILFTTGTTGRAKGVVLSHKALFTASAHINEFVGTRSHAIEVLPLPLSHSFGLGRLRCILSAGATMVLVPGMVNAARIVATIARFDATGFASVPTGIAILLNDENASLGQFSTQLDYVEIGSSRMPIPQKKELMRLLPNTRLCMHYGLTEASRSTYLSFHDDADHLDAIGKPSPRVEVRIVDESGRPVDDGIDGHIAIRGGHLMSEYWRDPERTAAALRDGWLFTGDIGQRDADGYIYLNARSSDLINVGGRKVSPAEIETVLMRHPAIAESACVGVPDPQGLSEEIVSVFLVAKCDESHRPKFADLAKLLRIELEPYKIPRKFTWVDELPRSSSGKLLRRYLRHSNL